jgi:hypothetical protein
MALIFFFLVTGSYLYFFAIKNGYVLSSNTAHWGEFGDYIGGVLNQILAFLSFMGVLLTVSLQIKHFEHSKSQNLLDEMQRLISGLSNEIDSMLKQPPKVALGEGAGKDHSFTIWSILSAISTAVLGKYPDSVSLSEKLLPTISLELGIIAVELHQLVWCLEKYKEAGGNKDIIDFYKKRYEVIVCWMYVIGLLSEASYQRVHIYFEPKKLTEFITPSS